MNDATGTQPEATTPVLSVAEGRATVCLNRPALHNRLEPADLQRLIEIFDEVESRDDCRVLILTATGKSFCSGFHIGALAERKDSEDAYDPDAFEKMVNKLEALTIPTIAAINGGTYGGATDMVLACDFRIGVEGMRCFMPATRLGIVYYSSGVRRYVSRLGVNNAKKMFLTAQPIEAEELMRMEYLTDLVETDQLEAHVHELADTIAANAPLAVAAMKKGLNEQAVGELDFERHLAAKNLASASEDHQEALQAWQEKRKPVFKGK
ncbi:MAG: enoyl-CoA hydratase/isomerase family protein [Pseudomonadota bacterium]